MSRPAEILHKAADIVAGARNQTHGDAENSFGAIAQLWDAYLDARPLGREVPLMPADVAAMMVLLKFARSMHGEHVEDHGIDAAGYAALWSYLRGTEVA